MLGTRVPVPRGWQPGPPLAEGERGCSQPSVSPTGPDTLPAGHLPRSPSPLLSNGAAARHLPARRTLTWSSFHPWSAWRWDSPDGSGRALADHVLQGFTQLPQEPTRGTGSVQSLCS